MGRKIPAKKHRGVKDPLEQQARRLQSVKGKINAPPSDPDEQPVPRSLLRLFAPRPAGGAQRPPNNKQHKQKGGGGRTGVSRLRALPGESAREFSRRISSTVRALHDTQELQYPMEDEDEEDSKGARMAELRERRARKQRRSAARRGAGPGPGAGPVPVPPPLSHAQKVALKRKAKKEQVELERREVRYERVPFGDVAHAPPALPPPRGAAGPAGAGAGAGGRRPAARALLLTAMLAGAGAGVAADERRRERARGDAVQAYRALKAQRRHAHKLAAPARSPAQPRRRAE